MLKGHRKKKIFKTRLKNPDSKILAAKLPNVKKEKKDVARKRKLRKHSWPTIQSTEAPTVYLSNYILHQRFWSRSELKQFEINVAMFTPQAAMHQNYNAVLDICCCGFSFKHSYTDKHSFARKTGDPKQIQTQKQSHQHSLTKVQTECINVLYKRIFQQGTKKKQQCGQILWCILSLLYANRIKVISGPLVLHSINALESKMQFCSLSCPLKRKLQHLAF